ncbi:GNAT family N-acetyltransferase [Amphibacillus sediminis]|uniref:GNAT family N-acetyltransferase n=1 Tax=Amphibacillus sediminis TaxID=360185 RepID=UPI00083089B1|nr:GNAT family N-acetyltransferase [Amphibacillus sediminis]
MEEKACIKLAYATQDYFKELHAFQLPDQQAQFAALPIKQQSDIEEGQNPIVILNGQEPVGFFLLHTTDRVKEYTDNPRAVLLTAFSINYIHQGKGYAYRGLAMLKKFITSEFSNINEVVLAVNHKNIPAQKLYTKVGFIDTGKRKTGPIGEQWIMKLNLLEEDS